MCDHITNWISSSKEKNILKIVVAYMDVWSG